VDEAYAYVKSLIFEGSVKPGGRVGIEDVMTHLGVSRQPVRDAINRLATAGFVTVIPQVGCVVPKIDPGEASDFFEIFRVVEGRMAAFAAERHTPAQLERALEISAGIERLLEADAIDSAEVERRFRASSRELHTAIHAMAASPTIERIAESLLDRFDYYVATSFGILDYPFRPAVAQREHDEVMDALAARDVRRATEAMERHIECAARRILKTVPAAESMPVDGNRSLTKRARLGTSLI
jgi:DNA-binding GntR family transcriptional regulator